MSKSQRARRGAAATMLLAIAMLLSACAPEPVLGWEPVQRTPVAGVSIVGGLAQATSADGEGGEGAGEEDPSARGQTAALSEATQKELGFYLGRLRNDAAGLAARFVYLPGVAAFNERMDQELRAATAATGKTYEPAAYAPEQGRTERGCVPGSSSWNAADVLSRPETGPSGGAGIAVVCDLAGAYGNLVEIRLRTVAGDPASVTSDQTSLIFVDVASRQLVQVTDAWNVSAAPELWRAVVELLRRDAGGLSTAPIADPDEEQLAIASTALHSATTRDEGDLIIVVPAGITSPELVGLGLTPTAEPIEVLVDEATATAWSNEQYRQLKAALGAPFVGFSQNLGSVPIDCTLLPCVAVTYDDGPSEYTPQLVNTLAAEGARATFFMLSSRATARPEVLGQVLAGGNEIATHTVNHPDLTTLPLPEAKAQLVDSAAVIRGITGVPVTMFRPPYGEVNDQIIAEVGMPSILWNVDTNDWRKPGQAALVERSAGAAGPGDIILFHDTHSDSVEAAGAVIRGLHDRGLELVTVTQLFDGHVPSGRVRSR